MLSKEKVMEILEAYDLTRSFRQAAQLCGVDHHTVRRYVAARAAGLDATNLTREKVTDPFVDKIAEWIDRSAGHVRADVVHEKLQVLGYSGSERTTRRVVAALKRKYRHEHHRVYKPWIPEPGLWCQFDYGSGPKIGGTETVLFCAWLSWSRYRVILPLWDRTHPSLFAALDQTFRHFEGVPTYVLTDNERTVTDGFVAGLPVRNQQMLSFAHYYGVSVATCVVADPESKGGSESTVKLAKADVLARPDNLLSSYSSFAALEAACKAAMDELNHRVHAVTKRRPEEARLVEAEHLHVVPDEPYTVAFGETRTVSWSSVISYRGARYSVPHRFCNEVVFVRRQGEHLVVVAMGEHGPEEIARHLLVGAGSVSILDEHYPTRNTDPLHRAPRPHNKTEESFLLIGEGARRFLTESAASGQRGITKTMAELVALEKITGKGALDEALGLAAFSGRLNTDDVCSILNARRELPLRAGEDHSLQQGTSPWAGFGEPEQSEQ